MLLYYTHVLATAAAKVFPTLFMLASGGGHEAEAGEHGGGHEGAPHLPNLVGLITGGHGWANDWVNVIFAFGVGLFFVAVSMRVYAKRQMIPGPFQNAIEMLVEGMYNFLYSVLGKEAKRYTPYLGTLFFYILVMNFLGLVPLGHAPSTSINITASLAICTFLYAQYTGFRRLGWTKYWDHMLGEPRSTVSWVISPLILVIHLIGEVAKPLSLALRLFGNITGEDILVAAFVALGLMALSFFGSPIGLPLNVPFILLGLLLSTIQALVFALLSTVYILMMLPHGEEQH